MKFNKALIGGSLILLITFNIYNAFNFVFHFFMARMLTAADYGILATLFSIIYMTGIFSESIQTIVAKYSASEKDSGKIKNFVARTARKSLKIASLIFVIFILAAIPFAFLLKIPYLLLTSTGLMIFAAFLPPITRGTMQGTKMFRALGVNLIIEAVLKLGLAVLLVSVGWKVYGAIAGTVIAAVIAFIFSLLALRQILKSKEKFMLTSEIYAYSWPVFFILFTVLVFYSIDIIIAKIVFPADMAGYYAIASILAKTIFFGTQPISKAMFPLSAEKKRQKDNHLLINSLGIILFCIIVSLVVLYFFPSLLIRIFSGRTITESSSVLFYLGIAFSLISLTNLILLYKLSLGKVKNYLIFLVFPAIEIFLLFFFSSNMIEYSIALITASAIFLWGSIFLLDR
jgi:O-antigen/teichoic acid export membrane protein